MHAVDASAPALEIGAECAALNGLSDRVSFERADAVEVLNQAGRQGGYDLVICDPPKLAPSRAAKVRATDSMRKLSASGCRATRPPVQSRAPSRPQRNALFFLMFVVQAISTRGGR